MEAGSLAEVCAADRDTMYSMYFPDVGRVTAAAVVGCVCLDFLTCAECERILGHSFLPIELAAREKQRTHVPVARVDEGSGQGLGQRSQGVDASDAAISGMADRLGLGLHPPLHGFEESADAAISGVADRPWRGSHPPSDGIEVSDACMADRPVQCSNGGVVGFEAGITGMAARLRLSAAVGERAKELFRKMGEARAWPRGPGSNKFRSGCPLAYAACLSIACRTEGSALSLRELARAAAADGGVARKDIARLVEHIRRRLGEDEAGHGKSSTGTSMVCLSSYVRRFGALVGLGKAEATVALEAARRLEEGVLVVRHNVDSVAAAIVCMALERAGAVRSGVKDVAAATGITNMTIYAVCRKLRAHDDLLFR